jgi:hypothetical protein
MGLRFVLSHNAAPEKRYSLIFDEWRVFNIEIPKLP